MHLTHLFLHVAAEEQDAKDDWSQQKCRILTCLFKNPLKESITFISPSLFQTLLHRNYHAPLGDTQGKNMFFGKLLRITEWFRLE